MKISVALSSALFATAILARPSTLAQRVKELKEGQTGIPGNSHPLIDVEGPEDVADQASTTVIYSANWAGPILTAPPAETSYIAVLGTFNVPQPSPPTTGAGDWYGAAWVGIDGYSNPNAILQAGVIWEVSVSSTGEYSYQYYAIYEWYPTAAGFYNFTVNAGDTISIVCEAISSDEGICSIENQAGDSAAVTLTAPSSTAVLTGQNAEWIVEDFTSDGLVPFADFGTVTFTGCQAFTADEGVYPNADTALVADIYQETLLTSVSFSGTNEVLISYV